ncbi:MAG: ATP-binding protein [Bryobacteraceae bacterium]|nr:ATP-binding protein [Bryobacteraceae bacterium]
MKELRSQLLNALLVILTAAACIAAFVNFQQNFNPAKRFRLSEDGVMWVDRGEPGKPNSVIALHVDKGASGDRAGIRAGDRLIRVGGTAVNEAIEVVQTLVQIKPWGKTEYSLMRRGVEFNAKVVVGEREPDYTVSWQYLIGIAYLAIGLFVYFRRGNAPKALHFLVLCLVSFVLSTFHYTGKLNEFDKVIYWGNIAAGIFAPTIFLHFCLTFPEPRGIMRRRGMGPLLYLPGFVLLAIAGAIAAGNLQIGVSPIELRWLLDRLLLGYFSFLYLLGAVALHFELRSTEEPIVRQQLKWLRNGAILGIVPFTVLYVMPYMMGAMPAPYMKWAVAFLPFIPITWAYAIVRYRLMDVDVIFQQGYVYTLATVAVMGVFYGLFFFAGRVQDLTPSAVVALILVATFVFQPIRNWVQETLDRHFFYRDRYDYRRTLIEFARELSSETDLDKMLESVADRLTRTLFIRRFAVFLRDEDHDEFRLVRLWGGGAQDSLDLRFLNDTPKQPYLFFERTKHALDVVSQEWPASVRETIGELDLTYYVPCTVRGRTISWLGVSRTEEGDFLSSDDLELVVTLSNYVGIAVENARLYASLQQKVGEYERLKEFSENIVESINVGVLACDLYDRIESWNPQIERLTGISREHAMGRTLAELFPADLNEKFQEMKGQTGIHNIYKVSWNRGAVALAAAAGRTSGNGHTNGHANGHVNENGNGNHSATPSRPRTEVIVNIAIAPLVSKDMSEIGRLIIFDDITDRSELEQRLLQADKLSSIGLLAAGVAHEVNTPLAVISTYAQMLAKQVSGDDQKSKLLEKIAKQTFRASEIVNSLLNFSRTSPAEFTDIDVNRIMDETVSLVRHQLERSQVRIVLDLQSDLPYIRGNPGKLQQVFLNLVLNARDAMETGGILTLRSRPSTTSRMAVLEISDTGTGIQPENLPRIYDPFFTTKVGRKGTGLGLSVTYGIMQEHGGSIDATSRVGEGTTFQLQFPLAPKPVAV